MRHWESSPLMMKLRYLRQTRISSPSLFSLEKIRNLKFTRWMFWNQWTLFPFSKSYSKEKKPIFWSRKVIPFKSAADVDTLLRTETSFPGDMILSTSITMAPLITSDGCHPPKCVSFLSVLPTSEPSCNQLPVVWSRCVSPEEILVFFRNNCFREHIYY